VPLRLSVAGLECTLLDTLRLVVGDWTMVDLYLITTIPRPLKLLAKVMAIKEGKGVLSFADLSDGVQLMLGRLVFRHHRREIALRRVAKDLGGDKP
jgi:hypothetical protein